MLGFQPPPRVKPRCKIFIASTTQPQNTQYKQPTAADQHQKGSFKQANINRFVTYTQYTYFIMPPKRVKKVMTLPINVIFGHLQVSSSHGLAPQNSVQCVTVDHSRYSFVSIDRKRHAFDFGSTKTLDYRLRDKLLGLMST